MSPSTNSVFYLMSDDNADATVVDRLGEVGLEERRLEDGARECDRIELGLIPRVHDGR